MIRFEKELSGEKYSVECKGNLGWDLVVSRGKILDCPVIEDLEMRVYGKNGTEVTVDSEQEEILSQSAISALLASFNVEQA